MKKKIIILASFIVVLIAGILYVNSNNLIADDKNGKKDCSSKCTDKASMDHSSDQHSGKVTEKCTDKADMNHSSENHSGSVTESSGFPVYEFVTDKIDCDGCKPGVSEKLMGISGVKEVAYGETCSVSKMTSVKVYYSDTETTPEIIAASIKDKGLECNSNKCGDKNKTGESKKL
ncbi:MAG: hypothetical protein HGGPFJEG_02511 [Ignavibacteria bacterium]|nr:hypothetical protein [Ignavibacteria bacterium]